MRTTAFGWSTAVILAMAPGEVAAQAQATEDPLVAIAQMVAKRPERDGLKVIVRDASGAPAPDAIVVAIPSMEYSIVERQYRRARGSWEGDQLRLAAAVARSLGSRYAVDAQGVTYVPRDGVEIIAVRAPSTVSMLLAEFQGSVVELSLPPVRVIPVRVVESDGSPVRGVRVGLGSATDLVPVESRVTDEAGRAAIPVTMPTAMTTVFVLGAFGEPVARPIPDAGDETIELSLPAHGRVHVRFIGGEPYAPTFAQAYVAPGAYRWSRALAVADRLDAQGCEFSCVAPGVEATVALMFYNLTTVETRVVGPAPGETATATIDLTGGPPLLRFRLLDSMGTPVSRSLVGFSVADAPQLRVNAVRTNVEGSTIALLDDRCVGMREMLVHLHAGDPEDSPLVAVRRWTVDVRPGVNELGDLSLPDANEALRGVLVDGRGKPVPQVRLRVDGTAWVADSGEDGSFALRMPDPVPERFWLTCETKGWLLRDAEPIPRRGAPASGVEITPGAAAKIVLDQRSRLLVRMPGLPDGTVGTLFVDVERKDERAGGVEREQLQLDVRKGALDVTPGRIDLVFRLDPDGEELLRVAEVHADPGVECHDARLMDLDWRSFASVATLHFVDELGFPVHGVLIEQVIGQNNFMRRCEDETVRVLVPAAGGRLTVIPLHDSLAGTRFDNVSGEHRVTLAKAPRVVVRTKGQTLPEGWGLEARIWSHEWHQGVRGSKFDAAGMAVVRAPMLTGLEVFIMATTQGAAYPIGESRQVVITGAETTVDIEWTEAMTAQLKALVGGR